MNNFLEKLIDLRDKHLRKQQELAEKLGVSNNYLSRLLHGQAPSLQLVKAVEMLHKEICSNNFETDTRITPDMVAISRESAEKVQTLADIHRMSANQIAELCVRKGLPLVEDFLGKPAVAGSPGRLFDGAPVSSVSPLGDSRTAAGQALKAAIPLSAPRQTVAAPSGSASAPSSGAPARPGAPPKAQAPAPSKRLSRSS